MSQLLKSSGALAGATMASRVLGLVREITYASFMGVSWVAGSFMFAFMVPNLFRRLLGEGALTAAFIPLFKQKEKLSGEAEMWRAANAVISALLLSTTVLVVLGIAGISLALRSVEVPQTRLVLELLRIMFPYVLLVCLAALFMGILNARGYFFVPALGASLLNVVMVAAVLLLAPRMGPNLSDQVFGLAIGVVVAGVLQAVFQLPLLHREGFRYHWVSPWENDAVRHVTRQMIPAALGVAAFQINVLLTQGIGFWVEADILAAFNYAVRLMELPQGVFGLSLATYLLPTLSGLAAEKKFPEFRSTVREGIDYIVFINLLATVLLVVLAEPIVRLLLERGAFDSVATHRSSVALMCLAPGLVAFSVVNILARAFFALGDIKTPMRISVFCLTLNILLTLAFVWRYREAGLGLANTISALGNMSLLFYALRRKVGRLELGRLRNSLLPLAGAAIVAGVAAWWSHHWWEGVWGHRSLWTRAGAVFIPMCLATGLYFGLSLWVGLESPRQIWRMATARLRKAR